MLLVFSLALSVYFKIEKEIFAIMEIGRNFWTWKKSQSYVFELPCGIQTVVYGFILLFFTFFLGY